MVTALDLRKLRCADGLHYSFQLLKISHEPMWELCCAIPEDNSKASIALFHCWSFIDSLHRIREIAQAVPGLSTKHPEMRAFLSATQLAEDYRHYIQHVRRELSKEPPNTFPVWGALSWVDPKDSMTCHTAMLGAQIEGMQYSSCVYDTVENRWVSKVCLCVASHSFNFDLMYLSADRFRSFVMPLLIDNAAPEIKFHNNLPITSASFRFHGQ